MAAWGCHDQAVEDCGSLNNMIVTNYNKVVGDRPFGLRVGAWEPDAFVENEVDLLRSGIRQTRERFAHTTPRDPTLKTAVSEYVSDLDKALSHVPPEAGA